MQPPAPNPLTFEEHRDLGQEVRMTRAKLLQLASVAASAYGPHSRTAFALRKAHEAMDRVCDELQAQAESDCPGLNAPSFYK